MRVTIAVGSGSSIAFAHPTLELPLAPARSSF
jgi:hypothetical protein